MQEIVYLLKIPEDEDLQNQLGELLGAAYIPEYVRLSTLAPLSNYGYPVGAEGSLIGVSDRGVVIGVADDPAVPRSLVPWSNISYLAESAGLENQSEDDVSEKEE